MMHHLSILVLFAILTAVSANDCEYGIYKLGTQIRTEWKYCETCCKQDCCGLPNDGGPAQSEIRMDRWYLGLIIGGVSVFLIVVTVTCVCVYKRRRNQAAIMRTFNTDDAPPPYSPRVPEHAGYDQTTPATIIPFQQLV